jgi:hypothetical protein
VPASMRVSRIYEETPGESPASCLLGAARLGPQGQEPTPALDNQAGSPRDCLSTAAVTPGSRSKRPHRSRAGGVLSLDSESLMSEGSAREALSAGAPSRR